MRSTDLNRSILESAPDAMILIEPSGAIVFANHQVQALFGYDESEIIGQPVEMLLPERFRAQHVAHRQDYGNSMRVRPMGSGLDLFARRRDGVEFPVEISLSPIQDGGRKLVAAAIRDVTERKQVQAELIAAREAAERANQAKSRFLATASHDLRQPLQTLAMLNGTLRRLLGDNADVMEILQQEEHAINAMSRLLNSLLDISKLESGAIQPEVTDFRVASLFEDLRREFASLAANKGIELRIEPCTDGVRSDPSLVAQILKNLVSNAIKYTRKGRVQLSCRHEREYVSLEVLDTGVGIPKEHIPYIFDEFYQVGVSPNTTREGYGLGLSIVQRLVQLLQAKLDVHSEPGKGSCFRLKLPASTLRDEVAQPTGRAKSTENHKVALHVMVVEDDVAVRTATRMLLRAEGYRVTTAGSLEEALEKARDAMDLEILVTDYHLGSGQTGLQVITALREALGRPVKAVLITGDTSSAVQAMECDDRLRIASKPIDADLFLSLISELVSR